jgi:hypothetical protein
MARTLRRAALLLFLSALLSPAVALAAGVQALFELGNPRRSPFPSDRLTVPDRSQNTGRRLNLPKPSCTARPSDCQDIDVLNTLDGFNIQLRLSVPFSGPIDVSTVNSRTVFLISLGSTVAGGRFPGHLVGINQIVWDPASFTLFAESDEQLDQHTRYALVVTRGVRDLAGDEVEAAEGFVRFRHDLNFGQTKDPDVKEYRKSLLDALEAIDAAGLDAARLPVALSVFTTQSVSSLLEKVGRDLRETTPAAADFGLGPAGSRTVFPLGGVSSVVFRRQVGTAAFQNAPLPLAALFAVPGAVGQIAFGKYASPDYETTDRFIPAIGTRTGVPAAQGRNDIFFTLFLPAGTAPPGGWPVALFGHGFGDSRHGAPWVVAATMAASGIATVAINVVGHGGGPAGTLIVTPTAGAPVTFPAGGRGIDQNGDGLIDGTEGVNAAPPRAIIGSRDGLRQTTIDLMQLVREIQVGMDVDGDGLFDLDPSRIYYFGQSFGGIYGTIFLGIEPDVRVGVPNVPGGSIAEISRLGVFRPLVTLALGSRMPSLLNGGPSGFNENIPLRDQPPLVNLVPGALEIQEVLEHTEWIAQSGNPVAYAPFIRKSPLRGMPPKSVIFQFGKGDKTVPNPTTTAILRAGDLEDRATYFRNDLAFAANPAVPKDPHAFLTRLAGPAAAFAFGGQQQIAAFFASDGTVTIDPDGAGPIFEVPIVPPLPEDLSFIP